MQSELLERLSADLDGVASALHRAGAPPEAASRLLELASTAVVEAVTLGELRDPANRLRQSGRVDALDRKIVARPAHAVRVVLTEQADRALPGTAF